MGERAAHSPSLMLRVACLISFALALATLARIWMPEGGLAPLLARFDLQVGNNLAALWTSLLLLLTAGHALARALEIDIRDGQQRQGWQVTALVLVVLSADTLASFQMRLAEAGSILGFGRWLALAPFALVLVFLILHALVLLRPRIDLRRFALLASGFGILLTVPLLEQLEAASGAASSGGMSSQRLGAMIELAGVIVLFAACLPGLDRSVATDLLDVADCTAQHTEKVTLLVAVLVLPAAAVTAVTWTGTHGLPANWLAMALSVLGILMALSTPGAAARFAAAGFALAALVLVEAGHLDLVPGLPAPLEVNVRLAALAVALAAVLPVATPAARPATFALILLTLALASRRTEPFSHYVVTPLIALAATLIAAGALRHRTAGRSSTPHREAFAAAD